MLRLMPRQVLIAPLLGFRKDHDWDRLERTIEEADATRVRLLTMPPEIDKGSESREHVRAKLKEMKKRWRRFEWDETHVDLLDFEATLQTFAKVFREEEGNLVSVALGTAGGPGATPSTIACLLWGGRGIYVGDRGYERAPLVLPEWLRLDGPLDADELHVLGLVVAEPEGLDKKTLLEKLKELGRIRKDQDKHAYRRLTSRFLPRLEEHGFVTVGPRDGWDGRHKFVVATEEGRRAWRVLAPMAPGVRPALHLRGRNRASSKPQRL